MTADPAKTKQNKRNSCNICVRPFKWLTAVYSRFRSALDIETTCRWLMWRKQIHLSGTRNTNQEKKNVSEINGSQGKAVHEGTVFVDDAPYLR